MTGSLLGSTTPVAVTAGYGGYDFIGAPVTFTFPTRIALVPSAVYTLELVRVDSTSLLGALGSGNGYTGGNPWVLGKENFVADVAFREGMTEADAAVPRAGHARPRRDRGAWLYPPATAVTRTSGGVALPRPCHFHRRPMLRRFRAAAGDRLGMTRERRV